MNDLEEAQLKNNSLNLLSTILQAHNFVRKKYKEGHREYSFSFDGSCVEIFKSDHLIWCSDNAKGV